MASLKLLDKVLDTFVFHIYMDSIASIGPLLAVISIFNLTYIVNMFVVTKGSYLEALPGKNIFLRNISSSELERGGIYWYCNQIQLSSMISIFY